MADATNRNKMVITSLLKPTLVCTGLGPDCFAVGKACSALSASSFPRRAGRECLEEMSFLQADSRGFVFNRRSGKQVSNAQRLLPLKEYDCSVCS